MAIIAKEGEDVESLLKKFKNEVLKNGILKEIKERSVYEKPSRTKYNKNRSVVRKRIKDSKREI